eukprot:13099935-Alexandrium_andersonii.AAC.1
MLKAWKAKVSSETRVKRKCFTVDAKALDALPSPPEDLEKWVIPKDAIQLPAEVYTEACSSLTTATRDMN